MIAYMAKNSKKEVALQTFKTPQELVHIKHRITLLQYKYWVLMLRAYREAYEERGSSLPDGELCFIPMRKLVEHLGYQPKTTQIESDLEAIRIEPIIFNVLEKDRTAAKTGRGFISEWHVSSNRVGVIFPPMIRESVENLDNRDSIFHLLHWQIFNSFTGKYEAILYKMCKDFIGTGRTKYMLLDDFRDYMGVKEEEYPDFKRLNQWVISGPIKRINTSEVSDITIKANFRREGRKIVGLWFDIASKRQAVMDFGDDPAFRFAKVSVSLAQQRKYLVEKGSESIELSIERANEYGEEQEKQGKTVDFGAIYRKAIQEDWGAELQSRRLRDAEKVIAENSKKAVVKTDIEQKRLDELKQEFQRGKASTAFKALKPDARKVHLQSYLKSAESNRIKSYDLEKGDLTDKTERSFFSIWLRQVVAPKFNEDEFSDWLRAKEEAAQL